MDEVREREKKTGVSLFAGNWWLRSPNPSNANNVRNVNTSGALDNNNANNSNGVAADYVNWQFLVAERQTQSLHTRRFIPILTRRIRAKDVGGKTIPTISF